MLGQRIETTKVTHIVNSTYRLPAGTALTIVRMLPRATVVGETHTGRWVIVAPNAYRSAS